MTKALRAILLGVIFFVSNIAVADMYNSNIRIDSLDLSQIFQCEKLAKKFAAQLQSNSMTEKQAIQNLLFELAANKGGADDDTLLRSPRLLLAIGGILVAGILVCVIANALKCRNITGSCRVVFPDNYSLTSQEQQAYSQLTTELQGNRLACDQDWDNFNHSVAQFANQLENVYFSSILFSSTDQVVIGVSERSS